MKVILKWAFFLTCSVSVAQTNLIDSSAWTVGTGDVGNFDAYQDDTSENERVTGTDPHGNTSVLWKGIPSGNGAKDGGWTADNKTSIDHTKTYRYTVWIKKTGSHDGSEIFGFEAYDSTTQDATLNLDGSADSFPWFSTQSMPQLGAWYLMVGYVHTSNYSSTTHLGAMYATDGTVVQALTDYKFATTAVKMEEKNILWADDNATSEIYYWNPTLYEVNGQEPTVQELLDIQAPTSPTLSSTGKTGTTVDLSWTGATDDTAVTGYKVFKDGVLETTLGNVSTYQVTGLTASTNYSFIVTALDAAANESVASNAIPVTTDASGGSNTGIDNGVFNLINSVTDQIISTISDGDTFAFNVVGDSLNIQAVPTLSYDQVKFTTSDSFIKTEGVSPYAYKGDVSGDYYNWTPSLGTLSFTVEYLNSGTVIDTDTFSITFVQELVQGGENPWTQSGSDINYTTGNVGIGTASPGAYKLAVNGNIHTKEVKVDLVGWADYVFAKDYRLPTLEEVKKHIDEKGHLINIPSAEAVEANGIQLGEMNKLLLEKIEELTLYIIDQNKRIKRLQEINKIKE